MNLIGVALSQFFSFSKTAASSVKMPKSIVLGWVSGIMYAFSEFGEGEDPLELKHCHHVLATRLQVQTTLRFKGGHFSSVPVMDALGNDFVPRGSLIAY